MPVASKAEDARRQRARRGRQDVTRERLAAAGAPIGKKERSGSTGLGYIADQLQPRQWEEVAAIAERVGFFEALIASGAATGGAFTLQMQVLPAFAHEALDLVQRSQQGVILFVAFQVPWSAFTDPAIMEDDPDSDSAWDTDQFGEQ
jgi:hypothetical protein